VAISATHRQAPLQAWQTADAAVRTWLCMVAALVFTMVVVGGATRLTHSGLSITEWQPILGAIPPLGDADWQSAFQKYQATPEYAIVNAGMSLAEFKFIYWWEWTHRFLGRFIGFAFAVPFVGFWLGRMLRPGFAPKALGVLALGGLQGAIGWYMVKSGLVDRVDVSQYRLALHLLVAFAILALLVWLALDVGPPAEKQRAPTLNRGALWGARLLFLLVYAQCGLGALVAGLKAGFTYNTWPLMDGRLVPVGLGTHSPWYVNLFENVTTVQFDHRVVAYTVVAFAVSYAVVLARKATDERAAGSAGLLAAATLVQMGIGIWTLVMGVPLALGLAHQAGAALVIVAATLNLHVVTRAASR
jgi:heme a synthase